MSQKFEQFVQSRFEYMACFLAGGMIEGSIKHHEISKKVLDTVSKQLHFVTSMDCNAAKRLLAITSSSPLIGTDKQELMCRLNDKVDMEASVDTLSPEPSSSGSTSSGSAGPDPVGPVLAISPKKVTKISQVHPYIHNYGNEPMWTIVCSPTTAMQTKLSTMAVSLKAMGVRHMSEKTAAAACALCRHFSILPDDSPDKALDHMRRLKEMVRLMWKDLPPCDVPAEYPATPEEFLAKYPLWHATAYAEHPPVPSPVAWQIAMLMYDEQPCRSTKAGCSPYVRSDSHAKQFASYGWAPPVGHSVAPLRMNQLQRAQHMQDAALGPHQQEPNDFPWLKLCNLQRQVAVPGMHPAGVAPQPVAGGVVMMDVDAGLERLVGARLGAVAVAPASEDAAAAALMLQDKAAPAAGVAALFGIAPGSDPAMGQEAAAVTPVVQNGLVAIEDKEAPGPLVALSAPKPTTMGDVAKMFREKHVADKAEAARKKKAEKGKGGQRCN